MILYKIYPVKVYLFPAGFAFVIFQVVFLMISSG
jgi:hypothetical protein